MNIFFPISKSDFCILLFIFISSIKSNVVLRVYNSLGELVGTPINERKESVIYSIKFSADHLPSRLYIAFLESGTSSQTVKMTLIK